MWITTEAPLLIWVGVGLGDEVGDGARGQRHLALYGEGLGAVEQQREHGQRDRQDQRRLDRRRGARVVAQRAPGARRRRRMCGSGARAFVIAARP